MLVRNSVLPLALLLPLGLVACVVDVSDGNEPGFTKDEARQLRGVDSDGNDICALEGWYDDSTCDTFCVEPDPDCPVSSCPDPGDPRVEYRAGPGDIACAQEIDFCGEDKIMFNSPECGCGCITPEPGEFCGGFAGETCAEGEFCNYAVEDMCGAGDQAGICQPIPQGCPENWAPVCGCDGVTYGNDCDANANGVSILHEGSCDQPVGSCGGLDDVTCPDGQYCSFDGCNVEHGTVGTCLEIPQGCPDIYSPVCGCDGQTYSNECDARAQQVDIVHQGTCDDPVIYCGYLSDGGDTFCPEGQFCDYELDDICGWTDAPGTCQDLPLGCPDNVDPVCGCDGETYFNECEANSKGVAVASEGACDPSEN